MRLISVFFHMQLAPIRSVLRNTTCMVKKSSLEMVNIQQVVMRLVLSLPQHTVRQNSVTDENYHTPLWYPVPMGKSPIKEKPFGEYASAGTNKHIFNQLVSVSRASGHNLMLCIGSITSR